MIEQVSVFLENRPGHLAQLARTLADAGINMRALMVADTEAKTALVLPYGNKV